MQGHYKLKIPVYYVTYMHSMKHVRRTYLNSVMIGITKFKLKNNFIKKISVKYVIDFFFCFKYVLPEGVSGESTRLL